MLCACRITDPKTDHPGELAKLKRREASLRNLQLRGRRKKRRVPIDEFMYNKNGSTGKVESIKAVADITSLLRQDRAVLLTIARSTAVYSDSLLKGDIRIEGLKRAQEDMACTAASIKGLGNVALAHFDASNDDIDDIDVMLMLEKDAKREAYEEEHFVETLTSPPTLHVLSSGGSSRGGAASPPKLLSSNSGGGGGGGHGGVKEPAAAADIDVAILFIPGKGKALEKYKGELTSEAMAAFLNERAEMFPSSSDGRYHGPHFEGGTEGETADRRLEAREEEEERREAMSEERKRMKAERKAAAAKPPTPPAKDIFADERKRRREEADRKRLAGQREKEEKASAEAERARKEEEDTLRSMTQDMAQWDLDGNGSLDFCEFS